MNLPNLKSLETPFGRYYQSPTNKLWYPSVTTVTGYAKNHFFTEWRKNPENEKLMLRASKRGTDLHLIIENYLIDGSIPDKNNIIYYYLFKQIQPCLNKISNIVLQEQSLWSDTIKMAGRVDCIADYEGKLSIIDFKGSSKEKHESYIQNYFEQTTCYAIMYSELFKKKINQIVILITSEDGTTQEFIKQPINYIKQTKETIDNYWKCNDLNDIQKKIGEINECSI